MSETSDVYFLLHTAPTSGEWYANGSYTETKADYWFSAFVKSRAQYPGEVPLQMILVRLHLLSGNVDVVRRYPEAAEAVVNHTEG